jgi:hypothetical protein
MAFSAAKWSLKARDNYIGWSEESRIKNLHYVVSNDRFFQNEKVTPLGILDAQCWARDPDDKGKNVRHFQKTPSSAYTAILSLRPPPT